MLCFDIVFIFFYVFFGSLKFSREMFVAHRFVRVWTQACKHISNGAKDFLMGFYFNHIWFRNTRTLSMFDLLSRNDFVFFLNFVFVFWMFCSSYCFGFRASSLLMYTVLWPNSVLRIFLYFFWKSDMLLWQYFCTTFR